MSDRFSLSGRVVAITGGAGLLGSEHAKAVVEAGGTPVLLDVDLDGAEVRAAEAGGARCLLLGRRAGRLLGAVSAGGSVLAAAPCPPRYDDPASRPLIDAGRDTFEATSRTSGSIPKSSMRRSPPVAMFAGGSAPRKR